MVASLGRSGSTLLQRLLNTHSKITIWGEHAGFLTHVARLIENTVGDKDFVDRLSKNVCFRDVIVGPLSRPDAFIPWVAPLSPEELQDTLARFVRDLFAADLPSGTRWGFKEIRYGRADYEALFRLFPRTTILVVIRDLPGYLRSRARAWRPNVAAGAVDKRATFEDMLVQYADRWTKRNTEFLDLVDALPEHAFTVPFTRLTNDPDFVGELIRRLIGSSSDPELIHSVLSHRAGSSDSIASDDWDEASTALLFDVVWDQYSNGKGRDLYERALTQSTHVLP